MASSLLYIKSKLLLPVHSEEEEEEDPRQELIQNLAEYKKYKEISSFFNDRKNICDYLYFKEPEQIDDLMKPVNNTVDISKLMNAFENIMLIESLFLLNLKLKVLQQKSKEKAKLNLKSFLTMQNQEVKSLQYF